MRKSKKAKSQIPNFKIQTSQESEFPKFQTGATGAFAYSATILGESFGRLDLSHLILSFGFAQDRELVERPVERPVEPFGTWDLGLPATCLICPVSKGGDSSQVNSLLQSLKRFGKAGGYWDFKSFA